MLDDKKIGPTGEFPCGKLSEDDSGRLQFRIGVDRDGSLVVVEFGSPVKWLALSPGEAIELADILLEKATILIEGPVDLNGGKVEP